METTVQWTDYMMYRIKLRGFSLDKIEKIVKYSEERYQDTGTNRLIAVGKHGNRLVMIPYERDANFLIPVTIHVTNRQQINFRIKTGRFRYG